MCGIAGQLAFRARPQAERVAELVAGIRHRGPDDAGVWSSPSQECVLGHARLSVIDLSPLGHQPMLDPETGNAIVFNGEIYNFQDLRRECEARGDRFRSYSDTEVILALYRRHGVECLARLRGMFAFALWDEGRKHLFLARDRVGKKPLNYALTDDGVVFCSELDPLARHPSVSTAMDPDALELYLQCQYVPAPWTIYKHVRKLPPAHYALMDATGFRLERYWEIDYTRKARISESDALDGLEEKLTEAVRVRMISDVPLGALLSGGVDSSVIVALMAKLSGVPVRTFSIGFREEAFNELPFARQAADICGTLHHPEIVEGDVVDLLPDLARHYGEPYADSSAIPSFFVSRVARGHVTVAMNGDGGDELLGGYPRYALSPLKLLTSSLAPLLPASRLVAIASGLAEATSVGKRAVRKIVTEYMWPELRSVNMYSPFWADGPRARLMGGAGNPARLASWRAHWLEGAIEHADNPVERMLWYDNHTYLPGDLLPKMDIASMHCGLETRSPLLDHEVIEFCAALPTEFKVRNGVGKHALKKVAERYFPRSFIHRRKMGFAIPLADWLKGPLRPVLTETLLDRELMEPLDGAVVHEYLDGFLSRGEPHSAKLWTLLMYGFWKRRASGVSKISIALPSAHTGMPSAIQESQ